MQITDYHREIFEFLEQYRKNHPKVNFSYALRINNRKERMKHTYLFAGTNRYIYVGLYTPNNRPNMLRTIGLMFAYDPKTNSISQCSLKINFDDLDYEYYEIFYDIMSRIGKQYFVQDKYNDKRFDLKYDGDWKSGIKYYLDNHKKLIDDVIKEQGREKQFFIPKEKLDDAIAELNKAWLISSKNPSITELMMNTEPFPLNSILYGPPGSGKTYETIDLAVEIIDGSKITEHKTNKIRFDQLRKEGQIEFVTFHQNYSYEDFVVGIKPDTDAGNLKFEAGYGVFYKLAEKARTNFIQSKLVTTVANKIPFDEVFTKFIEQLAEKGEEIPVEMASGILFHLTDVSERSIEFRKANGSTTHMLSIATLKRIYEENQEVKLNGLKAYYKPLSEVLLLRGQNESPAQPEVDLKRFVLIIDEINRANVSRVFGELITLLEEDKRLGAENELTVTLPNGEPFVVPPNLYLVGTMNTADKSLALLDIALRRRFEFIGKYPQPDLLKSPAKELLERLNAKILEHKKSADFLIGHAYFMGKSSVKEVMDKRVIPLLMEYFNGRIDLVKQIIGEDNCTKNPHTYQLEYTDEVANQPG